LSIDTSFLSIPVYLPIAEMSVNGLVILAMGGVVGFLSGMFGVGGGFLMTPLLIFIGVPPAVAVGTQANQLVAASLSGVMGHWRRRNVDVELGLVMLAGSSVGTLLGVWLFGLLKAMGQIDLTISILYVVLLGVVGSSMLLESLVALIRKRRPSARAKKRNPGWMQALPFKRRFPQSKLYLSVLLPGGIGFVGGVLVAVMGIGGGFLLVPAMIYILRMPVALVAGTSLFQIVFSTAATTLLQATANQTVDVALAFLLLVGGAVGAQFGTRVSGRLSAEAARLLLATLVVLVAVRLAVELVSSPEERYTIDLSESR